MPQIQEVIAISRKLSPVIQTTFSYLKDELAKSTVLYRFLQEKYPEKIREIIDFYKKETHRLGIVYPGLNPPSDEINDRILYDIDSAIIDNLLNSKKDTNRVRTQQQVDLSTLIQGIDTKNHQDLKNVNKLVALIKLLDSIDKFICNIKITGDDTTDFPVLALFFDLIENLLEEIEKTSESRSNLFAQLHAFKQDVISVSLEIYRLLINYLVDKMESTKENTILKTIEVISFLEFVHTHQQNSDPIYLKQIVESIKILLELCFSKRSSADLTTKKTVTASLTLGLNLELQLLQTLLVAKQLGLDTAEAQEALKLVRKDRGQILPDLFMNRPIDIATLNSHNEKIRNIIAQLNTQIFEHSERLIGQRAPTKYHHIISADEARSALDTVRNLKDGAFSTECGIIKEEAIQQLKRDLERELRVEGQHITMGQDVDVIAFLQAHHITKIPLFSQNPTYFIVRVFEAAIKTIGKDGLSINRFATGISPGGNTTTNLLPLDDGNVLEEINGELNIKLEGDNSSFNIGKYIVKFKYDDENIVLDPNSISCESFIVAALFKGKIVLQGPAEFASACQLAEREVKLRRALLYKIEHGQNVAYFTAQLEILNDISNGLLYVVTCDPEKLEVYQQLFEKLYKKCQNAGDEIDKEQKRFERKLDKKILGEITPRFLEQKILAQPGKAVHYQQLLHILNALEVELVSNPSITHEITAIFYKFNELAKLVITSDPQSEYEALKKEITELKKKIAYTSSSAELQSTITKQLEQYEIAISWERNIHALCNSILEISSFQRNLLDSISTNADQLSLKKKFDLHSYIFDILMLPKNAPFDYDLLLKILKVVEHYPATFNAVSGLIWNVLAASKVTAQFLKTLIDQHESNIFSMLAQNVSDETLRTMLATSPERLSSNEKSNLLSHLLEIAKISQESNLLQIKDYIQRLLTTSNENELSNLFGILEKNIPNPKDYYTQQYLTTICEAINTYCENPQVKSINQSNLHLNIPGLLSIRRLDLLDKQLNILKILAHKSNIATTAIINMLESLNKFKNTLDPASNAAQIEAIESCIEQYHARLLSNISERSSTRNHMGDLTTYCSFILKSCDKQHATFLTKVIIATINELEKTQHASSSAKSATKESLPLRMQLLRLNMYCNGRVDPSELEAIMNFLQSKDSSIADIISVLKGLCNLKKINNIDNQPPTEVKIRSIETYTNQCHAFLIGKIFVGQITHEDYIRDITAYCDFILETNSNDPAVFLIKTISGKIEVEAQHVPSVQGISTALASYNITKENFPLQPQLFRLQMIYGDRFTTEKFQAMIEFCKQDLVKNERDIELLFSYLSTGINYFSNLLDVSPVSTAELDKLILPKAVNIIALCVTLETCLAGNGKYKDSCKRLATAVETFKTNIDKHKPDTHESKKEKTIESLHDSADGARNQGMFAPNSQAAGPRKAVIAVKQ